MKNIVLSLSVAATLALAACGKKEETNTVVETPAPAAAAPMTPATTATTGTVTTTTEGSISTTTTEQPATAQPAEQPKK